MADEAPRKRLTFDPTINAGHLLTFASMVVAVFVSWNLLDKRVTVLEEAKQYQRERDKAQDDAQAQKFGDIKDSLAKIEAGLNELRRDQHQQQQMQQQRSRP